MTDEQRFPKIPVRTFIYAAIVIILAAIFVIQETTETRGTTMPVPEFDAGAVDQVRIEGAGESLIFSRSGDSTDSTKKTGPWTMGEESYPVAEGRIDEVLKEIGSIKRADVVTGRGNAGDYGLDEAGLMTVRIFTGNIEPVSIQLGDTAASGNAVYGRINGAREIVLLPRSLETAVSTDPLRFRERTMAEISADDIVQAEVTVGRNPPVVVQRAIEEDGTSEQTPDSPSVADAFSETAWRAVDPVTGEAVSAERLNAFVRELASLEASTFPEYLPTDGDRSPWTGDPASKVAVETILGETVELQMWESAEEERVPARITTSPYDFYIPRWRAERLLLGLTSGEE